MARAFLTHANPDRVVTLPLGQDWSVTREGECDDIALTRTLDIDCPLQIVILIRTDGTIVLWWTVFNDLAVNTYWRFLGGDVPRKRPTPAQKATLETMYVGEASLPGGLSGALSNPVCVWAFEG